MVLRQRDRNLHQSRSDDLKPLTSLPERCSRLVLHSVTLSTFASKFARTSLPSCLVSWAPSSPAAASLETISFESGYRSLGTFHVDLTWSFRSVSYSLQLPFSRPSLVSTSWVTARAYSLPRLQNPTKGIP